MQAPLRVLRALAALSTLLPSGARAQDDVAAVVLRLPASPRAAALGNAYTGNRGSDVVFATPAAVALATGLFASAARVGPAGTYGSAAASTAIGRVGIAFGVQWLDYDGRSGSFPTRVGDLTRTGPISSSSLAGTMAISYRLWGFRLGTAAKYVEERFGGARGSAPAFDVALLRPLGRSADQDDFRGRVVLGLVAQNLGPSLEVGTASGELPTRVAAGANSTRVPIGTWFDVAAAVTAGWERGLGFLAGGGVELFYLPLEGWIVTVRAGARRVDTRGPSHPVPVAFGGSIWIDRVAVEYAWEPWQGTSDMHRLGFRIQ